MSENDLNLDLTAKYSFKCLGQTGKITKVFLDGNLRVVFGKSSVVIPAELVIEKIQQITVSEAQTEGNCAERFLIALRCVGLYFT